MGKMDTKTGKELLLSFLYSPGNGEAVNEPILGRTKLVKMMFIFEKEISKDFFKEKDVSLPEFIPYLYGPYSAQVMDDLRIFIGIGYIVTTETAIPMSRAEKKVQFELDMEDDDIWGDFDDEEIEQSEVFQLRYCLSDIGVRYVEERIWNNFNINQKSTIMRFKKQINNMPLDDLLAYVYKKYPEFAEESLIKGRYL